MKPKKSINKDLENKKSIFFLLGLTFALIMVLSAFEYKSYEKDYITGITEHSFEMEEIEITIQPEQPKPEPPRPVPQKIEEVPDEDTSSEDSYRSMETTGNKIPEFAYIPIQPEPTVHEEEFIWHGTEIMPQFIGGDEALLRHLKTNLIYPHEALKNNIQGTVHVRFVVEKDGSISNVTIQRGSHPLLENEAIRVISNMPSWKPGTQRGRPVRVWQTLPVRFLLK